MSPHKYISALYFGGTQVIYFNQVLSIHCSFASPATCRCDTIKIPPCSNAIRAQGGPNMQPFADNGDDFIDIINAIFSSRTLQDEYPIQSSP